MSASTTVPPSVHQFTLHIETPAETTNDESARASIESLMQASPEISDATATLDLETGKISSTFQAPAETLDEAQDTGIRVFTKALDQAGLFYDHGWLVMEASGP
jgi:hypothetical protein